MSSISKLEFLQEYGSAKHKKSIPDIAGKMIDHGDEDVADHIANSEVKLHSHHIHKLIHMERSDGFMPPAGYVGRYRKLDDEHWDAIAKHKNPRVVTENLGKMPLKHLKTVANSTHLDSMIRGIAASEYRHKKSAGYPE